MSVAGGWTGEGWDCAYIVVRFYVKVVVFDLGVREKERGKRRKKKERTTQPKAQHPHLLLDLISCLYCGWYLACSCGCTAIVGDCISDDKEA